MEQKNYDELIQFAKEYAETEALSSGYMMDFLITEQRRFDGFPLFYLQKYSLARLLFYKKSKGT